MTFQIPQASAIRESVLFHHAGGWIHDDMSYVRPEMLWNSSTRVDENLINVGGVGVDCVVHDYKDSAIMNMQSKRILALSFKAEHLGFKMIGAEDLGVATNDGRKSMSLVTCSVRLNHVMYVIREVHSRDLQHVMNPLNS